MKFTAYPTLRPLGLACTLSCLLLLAPFTEAAPTAAASPTAAVATVNGLPVVVKNNSVSVKASTDINVDESVSGFQGDLMALFAALLKPIPTSVSMSCEASNPMSSSGIHILYDRVKHTVTAASYGGFNADGTYGDEVRFTSVRESAFAAIVNAYPKGLSENDPEYVKIYDAHPGMDVGWSGFQLLYLPRYGCRSRVIRHYHRTSK